MPHRWCCYPRWSLLNKEIENIVNYTELKAFLIGYHSKGTQRDNPFCYPNISSTISRPSSFQKITALSQGLRFLLSRKKKVQCVQYCLLLLIVQTSGYGYRTWSFRVSHWNYLDITKCHLVGSQSKWLKNNGLDAMFFGEDIYIWLLTVGKCASISMAT